MDFSDRWKQLLAKNDGIEGGILMTADGVIISSTPFLNAEKIARYCAAAVAIANEITKHTERGEVEACFLASENGYVVLTPVIDNQIFAVLASKRAKLGLVL